MAIARATVKIQKTSGVELDQVVNTFHISTPGAIDGGVGADIALAIGNHYTFFDQYFSPTVSAALNAHTIEVAEVSAGAPGPADDESTSPLFTYPLTLVPAAVGAAALPDEVAVVLSVAGDLTGLAEEIPGGIRPRARRRGRHYYGPFAASAGALTVGAIRPIVGLRTALLDAAEYLRDTLNGEGLTWAIYSRANGTMATVIEASVDDAFDTVRTRGPKASLRDKRVLVP